MLNATFFPITVQSKSTFVLIPRPANTRCPRPPAPPPVPPRQRTHTHTRARARTHGRCPGAVHANANSDDKFCLDGLT
jgi:hypothetical protein